MNKTHTLTIFFSLSVCIHIRIWRVVFHVESRRKNSLMFGNKWWRQIQGKQRANGPGRMGVAKRKSNRRIFKGLWRKVSAQFHSLIGGGRFAELLFSSGWIDVERATRVIGVVSGSYKEMLVTQENYILGYVK